MVPGARAGSRSGSVQHQGWGCGAMVILGPGPDEGQGAEWPGPGTTGQGQCLGLVVGPAGVPGSLTLNPWPHLTFLAGVRSWPGPYPGGGCSCSRGPAPSRQRRFLSHHKVSTACCPGSESSCEENGSLPGCACVCTCTRVHVCAHVCAGSQGAGSSGPSSPLPASWVWPGMFRSTFSVD